MKVLFVSRATLFRDKGGDTIQLINTAFQLKRLGIEVDIKINNDMIDYGQYDLIHFFNIIRPADILHHIEKTQTPFVISTIYVDYSEYEKEHRGGVAGFLFKILSPDAVEYVKTLARAIVKSEKIKSSSYLVTGHRKSIGKIMKRASILLPNSKNEYYRLVKSYGIEQKYKVIPNAIDPDLFFPGDSTTKRDPNLVLCVGRIEGLKNQLNLIRAVNDSSYKLIIIGSAASNQAAYFNVCKQTASKNIEFIERLPQQELTDYYKRATVHVLPSWFETTGLSSLEAAVMGCNIVITEKGDTREYFEDMAYYCEPGSPASIQEAIHRAANNPYNEALRKKILTEYTWEIAARKTIEAYQEVLLQ